MTALVKLAAHALLSREELTLCGCKEVHTKLDSDRTSNRLRQHLGVERLKHRAAGALHHPLMADWRYATGWTTTSSQSGGVEASEEATLTKTTS